jgi:catechol 2,3-dioxygenase-like lactoylglutathione lyase family enzyme
MPESLTNVGAITVFIADVERTKRFYERVFDIQAIYEDESSVAFQFDNVIVNFLRSAAAHELIEPAAVADHDSGARFLLTIWVDDAEATYAELSGRGGDFIKGPMDREWGMRTAAFVDPDGHIWEIAENVKGG